MSDFVTATPSIVGFTNGYGDHHGNWRSGVSDKDQQFAINVEANERTRDLLAAIATYGAANSLATEKVGAANELAVEKVGAANELATEKIGAAAVLTAEKVGAANVLASERYGYQNMLTSERLAAAQALAAERIGAANLVAIEKIGAANQLAVQLGFKEAALQLANCCCEIRESVAVVNATVLSVDANRIRDDLAQVRAELIACQSRNHHPGK